MQLKHFVASTYKTLKNCSENYRNSDFLQCLQQSPSTIGSKEEP